MDGAGRTRRLFAPEVVQTSALDCGPAALKCLLEGYRIPASYGRLREACQIDLDGTSIDSLEQVALRLGLEAEQIIVPADHVVIPGAQALPAVVVVRLPNGATHFVVAWRRHGRFLQVMDPARGRRWPSCRSFLDELYVHALPISVATWRAWVASDEFAHALRERLRALGVAPAAAARLLRTAAAGEGWEASAALDASIRMLDAVVRARGLRPGREASRVLDRLLESALTRPEQNLVPVRYWSVRATRPSGSGEPPLLVRGAVLIRVRGRLRRGATRVPDAPGSTPGSGDAPPSEPAADSGSPTRPINWLRRLAGPAASRLLITLAGGALLAAAGTVVEALLLWRLFDLTEDLGVREQRLVAMGALLAFVFALLLLDMSILAGVSRLGRHVETRLRAAWLEKIPLLGDRYFSTRPRADLAERGHNVHRLRGLPEVAEWLARSALELGLTVAAIAWLDPGAALAAGLAAVAALGVPLLALPMLQEWDLRLRTHVGALGRFYLDALLGLVPLRAHAAEAAIRCEHEMLVVEWARARLAFQRAVGLVEALMSAAIVALVAWVAFDHQRRVGAGAGIVLLVFWGLNLLTSGHVVTLIIGQQYPAYRSVLLRLLEPLQAPAERDGAAANQAAPASPETPGSATAVDLELRGVSVNLGGRPILHDIDVHVPAGCHVAIVGPSGAGKSSLVGLLLGWHRPSAGQVLADGAPLTAAAVSTLCRETAWVDPAVQLWNRSLLQNLLYGAPRGAASSVGRVLEQACLGGVVERLPSGLQTSLGEGGALVSGGEGQRVRLGRAMLRSGVRLALLDEPFSGLDRHERIHLLARARARWRDATLLYTTHDISETASFDRVLVVEGGRIIQDGPPSTLAGESGRGFQQMLDAARTVRHLLGSQAPWHRLRLAEGRLLPQDLREVS